ncbi:unnamed protein product [Meloidogyne enterolobii]|uniref:Uncharacterized protein n=1 Tax=Meloidogyne enterolobii TaxID=390850 RepID=A0ACB0ZZC6_MELEN
MRRTLVDLLIKDENVNYKVREIKSCDLNEFAEEFVEKNREGLQEANFIVFYNYLILKRENFLERLGYIKYIFKYFLFV